MCETRTYTDCLHSLLQLACPPSSQAKKSRFSTTLPSSESSTVHNTCRFSAKQREYQHTHHSTRFQSMSQVRKANPGLRLHTASSVRSVRSGLATSHTISSMTTRERRRLERKPKLYHHGILVPKCGKRDISTYIARQRALSGELPPPFQPK